MTFQTLQAKFDDLEAAHKRLRQHNTEFTERNEIYAQVVHALTTELAHLRRAQTPPPNVQRLPTDTTASPRT
ncbi:hypothetical protein [Streptomyces sp. NBC_00203]|uniref:hypothetical protein n=1 Tax=Streptomyces sp. NBC_00203 TaxID=2975680 RepID=UPI0032454F42